MYDPAVYRKHHIPRTKLIQRATEISYSDFAHHLHTNTIGPIITAQRLLTTGLPIGTIIFMSSDSGSALSFRDFEDGFGAYAASKAALNQMLRVRICWPTSITPHVPLSSRQFQAIETFLTVISTWPQSFVANPAPRLFWPCTPVRYPRTFMHKSTAGFLLPRASYTRVRDMADISTGWDIEGILTPQESVEAMLRVISTKTIEHSGTFWTWEGKVRPSIIDKQIPFASIIMCT